MKSRMNSGTTRITFAERLATALVAALAAAATLAAYFLINLAMASKSPSGPPRFLFELLGSNWSIFVVAAAALAGFLLGSARMAEVFAVLWGTSELWAEAWFRRLMASAATVALVGLIAYLLRGFAG